MRVRVLVALAWLDAGREHQQSPGDVVEVTPALGRSWLATGRAELERPGPVERKPLQPFETKTRQPSC